MSDLAEHICEALTIGPDDVLVVRVSDTVSVQQLTELAERIRARMPESIRDRVLVLGGAVEQIACAKGGA